MGHFDIRQAKHRRNDGVKGCQLRDGNYMLSGSFWASISFDASEVKRVPVLVPATTKKMHLNMAEQKMLKQPVKVSSSWCAVSLMTV